MNFETRNVRKLNICLRVTHVKVVGAIRFYLRRTIVTDEKVLRRPLNLFASIYVCKQRTRKIGFQIAPPEIFHNCFKTRDVAVSYIIHHYCIFY